MAALAIPRLRCGGSGTRPQWMRLAFSRGAAGDPGGGFPAGQGPHASGGRGERNEPRRNDAAPCVQPRCLTPCLAAAYASGAPTPTLILGVRARRCPAGRPGARAAATGSRPDSRRRQPPNPATQVAGAGARAPPGSRDSRARGRPSRPIPGARPERDVRSASRPPGHRPAPSSSAGSSRPPASVLRGCRPAPRARRAVPGRGPRRSASSAGGRPPAWCGPPR